MSSSSYLNKVRGNEGLYRRTFMVICFYIKPNLFPAQNHLSRKKLKKKKKSS